MGHINEMTFLKRTSYYGPQEEYICCGGDGGNIFFYSTRSGELVHTMKGDGLGHRQGIVNGVVPHVNSNSIVSYGIDSDAKLWTVNFDEKDDDVMETSIAYVDTTIKSAQRSILRSGTTPPALCCTLVRCARTREQCKKMLEKSEIVNAVPSSSLILSYLDEDEPDSKDVFLHPYHPKRFEFCVKKVEQVRERGNIVFHEEDFQTALKLYSIGVHYCLGACLLQKEMVELFKDQEGQTMDLITQLDQVITSAFAIEFDVPKRKSGILCPAIDDLKRIVSAFKEIWSLFLTCNLNAAQAALKLRDHETARAYAEQAIEIDPSSTKARFRRALALMQLRLFKDALKELKRVKALPGGDTPLVQNYINRLTDNAVKMTSTDSRSM